MSIFYIYLRHPLHLIPLHDVLAFYGIKGSYRYIDDWYFDIEVEVYVDWYEADDLYWDLRDSGFYFEEYP